MRKHLHQCNSCNEIWSHGKKMKKNKLAHKCPNCGQIQFKKLRYKNGQAIIIH